ncbi:MAG: prepilin-type N-terminal cleavage/methylation domain-containing protein [Bacilli bacterium]|nr:prepilin-type N-terminal cleavage/methylation domain-containing protein [Bacilli bacterium]
MKKGFTLIELLAVIVILGVIMVIAIPSISNYIIASKNETFVTTAKQFISAVKTSISNDEYILPVEKNEVTIIPISSIDLNKGGVVSPYGNNWIKEKSYIAIINDGDNINPEYTYYIAMQDSKNYAIPLTKEISLNKSVVISNAKNTMEITIQDLSSGLEDISYDQNPPSIIGLPDVTKRGSYTFWISTIYNEK